ncbi:hypothetical protein FLP41_01720 (plasmid) [Paracoccus marcusii]|uniref:hypothetical protein n=1 Tax=Paracoccus marcusii TaxID=59779 RepID=UPI002ED01E1A|nr:hypothetical protein FLP41_01720 [Paracoccus marcusii]
MVKGIREPRLATAEFSRDMVETMLTYFDAYADEGVLSGRGHQLGPVAAQQGDRRSPVPGLAKLPDGYRQ